MFQAWQSGSASGTLHPMKKRLEGKRALVTAAAQGIGEATARAFAEAGATVVATDINADKLAELASVAGITTRVLDVTDAAAITALIEREAHFDVLFNCAGFVHHGSILDCTDEEWDMAFDLNVKSMYRLSKAVLPGMLAAGCGSIINIASIAAHKGLLNRFAYGASKAAVVGLTKSIAADFVTRGIRCNAIAPGTVQSPSLDSRIAAFDDPVAARQQFIARQPMGRLGTPSEIAYMALYLASDESIFTTGTLMNVDGGMSI
jgi:2-keto-3-deoxy-L-fuconate dehydrogenase